MYIYMTYDEFAIKNGDLQTILSIAIDSWRKRIFLAINPHLVGGFFQLLVAMFCLPEGNP